MHAPLRAQWLAQLCAMLPRSVAATLYLQSDSSELAQWAASDASHLQGKEWQALLAAASQQQAPLVSQERVADRSRLKVVYPLHLNQQSCLLACLLEAEISQQGAVLQVLAWGEAWLRLLEQAADVTDGAVQSPPPSDSSYDSTLLTRALSQGLNSASLEQAAYKTCHTLAQLVAAQQVVLIEQGINGPRVCGLSDRPDCDARSEAMQTLLARYQTWQDAGQDQAAPFRLNQDSMLATQDAGSWWILPLQYANTQWRGALLLAMPIAATLEGPEGAALGQLAPPLAAMIALHARQVSSAGEALSVLWRRLSPRQSWRAGRRWPALVASVLALFVLLGLWQRPYHISAPVVVEPLSQRALVAPFDGFIASAERRAGDAVAAGEIIARLDPRQLELERQRWLSQRDEYQKQHRQALARREHADASIILAQLAQAEAQLKLVETRMQRTVLRAPIDGVIVEGDLSRSLDAPVQQGQVLFQLAPRDAYRVVYRLNERDVPLVTAGQPGEVRLKAFPQQSLAVTLQHRDIVYQQDNDSAWYRAEAELAEPTALLRPGMEGRGSIRVSDRSLLWQWTRDLRDWWQLLLWRWWP